MKEVLFKFKTEEQASEFMRWFSEYGQQEYINDATTGIIEIDQLCPNIECDYENNIINLYK